MRQLRAFLFVLIAGMLVGVVLAGCSGGSAASEDPGAGSADDGGAEAVQETEEPTEIPPRDYNVPEQDANRENPLPADDANLQRGKEIYEASCIECHGELGRGDGPTASRLNPPPVDFQAEHIRELSDGELYSIITNAVEGTAMPKFNYLEEERRWQLVNFIRSLQEQ